MILLSESLFIKLLSIFFISFASYFIARKARVRINKKGLNVKNLFFSFNKPRLAAVGNISSAFSVNFFFGLVLFSAYGWGYVSTLCILVAICAAWVSWHFLLPKINSNYFAIPEKNTLLIYSNIAGYLTHNFSPNGENKTYKIFLGLYFLILFYLSVCEFSILRIYLATFYGEALSKTIIIIIAILTFIYSSLGGLLGVLKTDKFQFSIILTFLCIIWFNIVNQNYLPDMESLFWIDFDGIRDYNNNIILDYINYLAAFFFVYFVFLLYPDMWMRNISTLSSPEDALKAINRSFPFILMLVITPACIGLTEGAIANSMGKPLNYDFLKITKSLLYLNKDGLSFFFLVSALICASITTLDTLIILILQHLSFKLSSYKNQQSTPNRFIKILLFCLIGICTFCFFSFLIGSTDNSFDDGSFTTKISWQIFGVVLGSLIIYPGYILAINILLGKRNTRKFIFLHKRCDLITSLSLAIAIPLGIMLSFFNNFYSTDIINTIGEIWHPVIPLTVFPIILFLVSFLTYLYDIFCKKVNGSKL
jgi:hypothetical protein